MSNRVIVVIGESGQVARALRMADWPQGWKLVFAGRETLDLLGDGAFGRVLSTPGVAGVINAAAYTAVDKAESDAIAAYALNCDAPGRLAEACAAQLIPFVHFSTDYVFNGEKRTPYTENDARGPINVYGASKAQGEDRVVAAGGRFTILRTSWVYSSGGANFLSSMLRMAGQSEEISVVDDQIGTPTWAADCAEGAILALEHMLANNSGLGLLHLAGNGEASWAEFAEEIFRQGHSIGLPSSRVRRISTLDCARSARRPMNSRLDAKKIEEVLGWRPRTWRESLARCLKGLGKESR